MGDKLIFYIPTDGDTFFDSSLISVCRAVEGFIRDKYEKKKYMDRSLDINVLRVGCKSLRFVYTNNLLFNQTREELKFPLYKQNSNEVTNGPKWSVNKCESSLS